MITGAIIISILSLFPTKSYSGGCWATYIPRGAGQLSGLENISCNKLFNITLGFKYSNLKVRLKELSVDELKKEVDRDWQELLRKAEGK